MYRIVYHCNKAGGGECVRGLCEGRREEEGKKQANKNKSMFFFSGFGGSILA